MLLFSKLFDNYLIIHGRGVVQALVDEDTHQNKMICNCGQERRALELLWSLLLCRALELCRSRVWNRALMGTIRICRTSSF